MALSNTSILYIVELVLYILITPFVVYDAYRHGRHSLLGYFYLNVSCILRIVSDIVNLAEGTGFNDHPSLAATVISSIGLSPLLLALAGFLHEIHFYVLKASITSEARRKKANRWLWFAQLQIHTVAVVGVVLLVIGGVHLATETSSADVNHANTLRQAGTVLLLITWAALVHYSVWLLRRCGRLQPNIDSKISELDRWTLLGAAFVGVKVVYAVVYTFDTNDAAISPVTGSLAVKVVLIVLVELLAVLALTIGGWRSLGISKTSSLPYTRNYNGATYRNANEVESAELTYARSGK